jgi:hypothetical protein
MTAPFPAPLFVETRPDRVTVTCRGVTVVGASRAEAIRELVRRLGLLPALHPADSPAAAIGQPRPAILG